MSVPATQGLVPIALSSLLTRGCDLRPDDTALISAEGSWTWRDLDRASTRYAASLLSLDLEVGERVASLMPNCDALMVHYLGCFKAGLVATPLNYRYTHREIDHSLRVSGASVLLAHRSRDADLAASEFARDLPLGIISYGGENGRGRSFDEFLEGDAARETLPVPASTDPAILFFTSGSTGPAKGVTHSFGSLGWMIACLTGACGVTAEDVVLSGASASHIGAFLDNMMGLAAGARVVIPQRYDAQSLLPLLRRHRPTVLVTLPAALFELVQSDGARRDDFASIRLCSSGGDKIPAELAHEFEALTGLQINEQYGMSEIGIATINPVNGSNKIGSVGRAISGYQMVIRGVDDAPLPPGSPGRLWVKSPCNMTGYWDDPKATAATIKDGWLDTGDVMQQDEDGYFWFCGRQKQIIVHDGSNISPQEVEDALMQHQAVALAGVVGVRDTVHGENVRAYVTLKEIANPPADAELIAFARARVGYKAPQDVFFLDHMPMNATGKIDRERLKKMSEEYSGSTE